MKPLLLLCALFLPACSHFTESGRIDRAYARHMKEINKMRVVRQQERAKAFREAAKVPPPPPENPVMVSVNSGDQ
jgi:hypothetical protein